jgi:hypothetical protein
MSAVASTGVPAGWHPDPMGSGAQRWWDGARWTAHTRLVEVAPPAPPIASAVSASAATAELPSRRAVHARLTEAAPAPAPSAPAPAPAPAPAALPAPTSHVVSTVPPVPPPPPAVLAERAWLETVARATPAYLPDRGPAAVPVTWTSLPPLPERNTLAWAALISVIVTPVVSIGLGAAHVPNIVVIALGIVPLVLSILGLRRGIATRVGIVPAAIALGLVVLEFVLGVVVAVVAVVAVMNGVGGGRSFARDVADELRISDHASSVVCPPSASPGAGSRFTCSETMPDGSVWSAYVTVDSDSAFGWSRVREDG